MPVKKFFFATLRPSHWAGLFFVGFLAVQAGYSYSEENNLLRQNILNIEVHRIKGDKTLIDALDSKEPEISQSAALALGRIKDTSGVPALSEWGGKSDTFKETAAFSLGLIGDAEAVRILAAKLKEKESPQVRSATLLALGLAGDEGAIPFVIPFILNDKIEESVSESAMLSLARLWQKDSKKWEVSQEVLNRLIYRAQGKGRHAVAAAYTLSCFKGNPALLSGKGLYLALKHAKVSQSKALLLSVIGRRISSESLALIHQELKNSLDLNVKVEALRAMRGQALTPELIVDLRNLLREKNGALVVQTLDTIGSFGKSAMALEPDVMKIMSSDPLLNAATPWAQSRALVSLNSLGSPHSLEKTRFYLGSQEPILRQAAIRELGRLTAGKKADEMPQLLNFLASSEKSDVTAALDALKYLPLSNLPKGLKAQLTPLLVPKNKRNSKNQSIVESPDSEIVNKMTELIAHFQWKDFVVPLKECERRLSSDQSEAKRNVRNILSWLVPAKKSRQISAILPSPLILQTPRWEEAQAATNNKVLIKTQRGDFKLKLNALTPLSALRFSQLVKQHYYDKKSFGEMQPNYFLAEGTLSADPAAGNQSIQREEFAPDQHWIGTVAWQSSGPEYEGNSFFINLSPNLHFDAVHTAFAEVEEGFEVVQKLEQGDSILSAEIISSVDSSQ